MNKDRINEFITLDNKDVISLMAPFDASLEIIDFLRMNEGMGNTSYKVTTQAGKFLLKLYSNPTDCIDTATHTYLKDKINVPELYYYDGGKLRFPFAYTIIEFIDGVTLLKYLRTGLHYPSEIVFEIGRMCATIHKRKYMQDAILDDSMNIFQKLPCTREKILFLLENKPAGYLEHETVDKLRGFVNNNPELFDKIEAESVLCHGDFNYGNIMISGEKVFCIDFEYVYSGSRYHDIGHFFRRKDDDVQALIDEHIYNSFAAGYNSVSDIPLPPDWITLAHLCDINAMLCLLNHDGVPSEWVKDIEKDILNAIEGTLK